MPILLSGQKNRRRKAARLGGFFRCVTSVTCCATISIATAKIRDSLRSISIATAKIRDSLRSDTIFAVAF